MNAFKRIINSTNYDVLSITFLSRVFNKLIDVDGGIFGVGIDIIVFVDWLHY